MKCRGLQWTGRSEMLRRDADIDVALVDWNMPVMNGLDFVRALRARKEYDGVKLMMVTTENDAPILKPRSAPAPRICDEPSPMKCWKKK